ncbi:hypothetical protein CROQUDRAFT_37713 [Cronartium quercuum f. sp. fusiforme G11]|uniref:Uncharacterized protein n=1 Tax=Cronartium quercuum f. sp. fusiforme G11 TaxID=708437 RepID=A0A9P6NUN2_9BASI|nr:hypothetical protein CROQUDRAFT_37713 [Cronartium quercuum f. sp. fusiforme G11]
MDAVNQVCFEQKIMMYTERGAEIHDLPAKLWEAVTNHHASQSEELRLLHEHTLNLPIAAYPSTSKYFRGRLLS